MTHGAMFVFYYAQQQENAIVGAKNVYFLHSDIRVNHPYVWKTWVMNFIHDNEYSRLEKYAIKKNNNKKNSLITESVGRWATISATRGQGCLLTQGQRNILEGLSEVKDSNRKVILCKHMHYFYYYYLSTWLTQFEFQPKSNQNAAWPLVPCYEQPAPQQHQVSAA